jgi:hypothetical protein
MPYFGSSPSGEAAKTGVIYKKPICSSVNRGMYGHVTGRMGEGGGRGGCVPSMFLGYVQPRNIFHYIRRLDVIEEYMFISLGTDDYMGIYSSKSYSSFTSLVNRGI